MNGGGDNIHEKKSVRGNTYMASIWLRKWRKDVDFNNLGHPIGPNKSELVEFIGSLSRNDKLVRLDIKDWHKVPRLVKDKLVQLVKAKFIGPPGFEHWVEKELGSRWKSWKNRVKTKFFDPNVSIEAKFKKKTQTEDGRVRSDQWKNLVIYWNSKEAKDESARNK